MDYALTSFDELVHGRLTPFNYDSTSSYYIEYLKENFNNCSLITIGNFKKQNNQLILIDKKQLCCIHPAAKKYISTQQSIFQDFDFENFDQHLWEQMGIQCSKIRKVHHHKLNNKKTVAFVEDCLWEKLPESNIKFYFYCAYLKKEMEQFIKIIKHTVHRINSKQEIEQYIHKYQQSLFTLCMKVLQQLDINKKYTGCNIKEVYNDEDISILIYYYLEKLLRFIEGSFLNYIDRRISIPFQSKLLEEFEINLKLEAVEVIILESNIATELKTIILSPLFKLKQLSVKNRISYLELIYINTYVSHFHEELKKNPNLTQGKILKILVYINYNAPIFFCYITLFFENEVNQLKNIEEQLNYLFKLLKETNQQFFYSQFAFDPDQQSLKSQLSSWIQQEIQYKESSLKLKLEEQHLFSKLKDVNPVKLETTQSVAELALFLRLQVEAEILIHKNQTELFQHLAFNYRTPKAKDISATSIKMKYYRPESFTISSLHKQLKKMIEILENI
jgi:hypothetical protein